MYRFESATDKANDDFPEWAESKQSSGYQKLKTIAAQERFDQADPNKTSHVSTETITFRPNQPGFYIAFKTSATCMSLQRVRIFYYNCAGFTNGLTEFPNSPSDSDTVKKVKGTCVNFAVPIATAPQAYCNQQGDWLESNDQCQCQAGYERSDDKCIKCPVNYYKADASPDQCSPCPNNRYTSRSAAKACHCKSGYRSTVDGNMDQQCYRPARRPLVKVASITTDSIEYNIAPPNDDSERVGLTYEVTVCTENRGTDAAYGCIDRGPAQINGPSNIVPGLQIDTDYIMKIKASNIVTKSSDIDNTNEIRFRTKLPTPGAIYGFTSNVKLDQGFMELEWEGLIGAHYMLEMTLPAGSTKVYNLTTTSFKQENIQPGPYMINLQAINAAGAGPQLTEQVQVQLDDALPIHMYGVAAATGLLFVIMLVVSLYCCCCRQKPKPERKKYLDENAVLVEDKVLEVAELQSPSSTPAVANNYDLGPDDLMPNFDYMEINPIDIQMEKAIMGEGEFAEVRKAYLVNKLGERQPVAAKKLKTGVGMRAQLDFIGKWTNIIQHSLTRQFIIQRKAKYYRDLIIHQSSLWKVS